MPTHALSRKSRPVDNFAAELFVQLQALDHIEPEGLADLFRFAGGDDEHSMAVRNVLHEFLLDRTIRHARRHTAYYKDAPYADWRPGGIGDTPRTDNLPVLRRTTVVERFDEFIADDVTVRSVCHTSGTTGIPLDLYKSHEEVNFIQHYYRRLFEPVVRSLAARPLVLTFPNMHHGVSVPMPSIGMTFVGGVTDDTLIQDARRVLESSFNLKGFDLRISLLSGLDHHVLLFTSYLLEQGIQPSVFHLKGVIVTGGYLAPNWIRFLSDAWGCPVQDRFTLTEAIGGASRLFGTDIYQLDPHILGEIVDPDSDAPTGGSIGLLTLTNFYPFVQMQPMIRYTVGDLVRRVPAAGPLRFQFLGKVRNCISWQRGGQREWLLFSARLNELINRHPDFHINEWFSNIRVVHDRTIGSLPVLAVSSVVEGECMTIRIAAELRYAPHTRPDRVEELRRDLLEGLRDTPDTALARRLDAGDVAVVFDFRGPGALNVPIVIKI